MKWSLFNWKKPRELAPGDYQNLKNTVNNNTTEINNIKTNYTTLNTTQTITGLKTFRAAPVGLKLQQAAGRSDKQYITFSDPNNTTTFSLGSQLTETSFEVNRGNLKIQTLEAGKSITFETPLVYFNRSIPQFGAEIKAGYGAGLVKFLPEDNSTKTLQFFETNNTSQRRFKLAIPEPVDSNNPATKNYVDTANNGTRTILTDTRNTLTEVDRRSLTNESEITNIKSTYATQRYVGGEITQVRLDLADSAVQKRDYVFTSQSSTPTALGEIYQYSLGITDLQETTVLGVNVSFKDQSDAATKATYWNVSWVATWGPKIYIKIFVDKFLYNGVGSSYMNLDFSKLSVRVFYVPKYNTRESEKVYQGEVIKLPEIKGGK